ncbi:MAG TPA: hypothetical protein VGW32_00880 [Pyrinomonadaceae bacterium]|nr:hypothetical protein [Pyrinomonadaceae bacterium]
MNQRNTETSAQSRNGILSRLFPARIDNGYQGSKIALWILGLMVAVRTMQSVMILVNGSSIAQSADGIPLDTYPAAAAQTIVALFALSAVNRLVISLICVVVLVRYRRAVPLMFLLLLVTYTAGQLVGRVFPIVRVGQPPAVVVNLTLLGLTILGLVLSLWKRRRLSVSN